MRIKVENTYNLLLISILGIFLVFTSGSMRGINEFFNGKGYALMGLSMVATIYISIFYIIYSYILRGNINIIWGNIRIILMIGIFTLTGLYSSIDIVLTIKGIIYLLSYTLFSIVFVDQFKEQSFEYILKALILVVVINIIYMIIFPYNSIDISDSRFNLSLIGMFYHKNSLASFMSIANIAIIINLLNNSHSSKNYLIYIVMYIATLVFVLMSNSVTSLLILLICNILVILYKYLKFRVNIIINMVSFQIAFYVIILGSKYINDLLIKYIGRDLTLTGRVDIWKVLINLINKKPLVGYGYGTVWNTEDMISYITSSVGFDFLGSHNGPLQIIMEVGFIGFFVFFVVFFLIPSFKVKNLNLEKTPLHMFIYIYYAYLLIYTISEPTFDPENFQTFLLIILTVYMNKEVVQQNKYKLKEAL